MTGELMSNKIFKCAKNTLLPQTDINKDYYICFLLCPTDIKKKLNENLQIYFLLLTLYTCDGQK